jgi:capsid protein
MQPYHKVSIGNKINFKQLSCEYTPAQFSLQRASQLRQLRYNTALRTVTLHSTLDNKLSLFLFVFAQLRVIEAGNILINII